MCGTKGLNTWTTLILTVSLSVAALACTTPANFRAKNRERLNQLSVGMTKTEVLSIMGTRSAWLCTGGAACLVLPALYLERATNPHRTESQRTSKGLLIELVLYQTDTKSADGATTDDELTPFLFEDGVLVGWGWSFVEQNVERYEIRMR